ncbi:hypothetical protein O181_102020 [Austropuccinia psidii MF-1]|uniref:Uncharacterized protein n=1 Tax=Austropuccinia psidii MF-1 TaxID=1389203 RepID=A0A9Q3JFI8_9BASI|nr:hypothetical protein [Austropuccinia psidii MF-1]
MPQTLPSPLFMLPPTSLILSTAYHPYAPAAPSRCNSDSALTTPYTSALALKILMLLHHPQDMPPTPPPHLHAHPSLCLIFSTTYHSYSPILDP